MIVRDINLGDYGPKNMEIIMRSILVLIAVIVCSSSYAQFDFGPCEIAYFEPENFGLGEKSAFTGKNELPVDSRFQVKKCYQIGQDQATKAIAQFGTDECNRTYALGFDFGINNKKHWGNEPETDTSACFFPGYRAGKATLKMGAREGNVKEAGNLCIDSYKDGHADETAGSPAVYGPSDLGVVVYCYYAGYADSFMFKKLGI